MVSEQSSGGERPPEIARSRSWIETVVWPKVWQGVERTATRWKPPLSDAERVTAATTAVMKLVDHREVLRLVAAAQRFEAHHWALRAERAWDELRAYVYPAGVNSAIEVFRHRGSRPTPLNPSSGEPVEVSLNKLMEQFFDPAFNPADDEAERFNQADRIQFVNRLRHLLDLLPDTGPKRYRSVILLYTQLRQDDEPAPRPPADDDADGAADSLEGEQGAPERRIRLDIRIAETLRPDLLGDESADSRKRAGQWVRDQLRRGLEELLSRYKSEYKEAPITFRKPGQRKAKSKPEDRREIPDELKESRGGGHRP